MKKHVLLAMAVIMVLGSVKALAMSDQDLMDMNQQSKVEAMVRNQQMESLVDQDAKIQGSRLAEITSIRLLAFQVGNALIDADFEDGFKDTKISQIDTETHLIYVEADLAFDDNAKVNSLFKEAKRAEKDLKKIIADYGLKLKPLTQKQIAQVLNGQ